MAHIARKPTSRFLTIEEVKRLVSALAKLTAIYAHISHDLARRAADRVTASPAVALGRAVPKQPTLKLDASYPSV